MLRFYFTCIISLLLLPVTALWAQNLVPNASFEEYYDCPNELGTVKLGILKDWIANPYTCTPDYYHKCSKNFGVPINDCGELAARSGKGYIGMILRTGSPIEDPLDIYYREHIQTKLLKPLKKNYRYLVKMYVSLSEYSNYALANIGILFFKENTTINNIESYQPQILEEKFIVQPKVWTLIMDTLVAQGGEKYLIIGEFKDFNKKEVSRLNQDEKNKKRFSYSRAYYFIDDVSVEFLDSIGSSQEISPLVLGNIKKDSTVTPVKLVSEFGILEVGKSIILKNIFFEFAEAELLPDSFEELNKLAKTLHDNPTIKIQLVGHTDDVGSEKDNLELSINRAKNVAHYLLKQGISGSRITFVGYGSNEPIDDNSTPEGRQNNRRVEFFIKK